MNGSTASASANRDAGDTAARDLVISVNWIGDAIMAMPALQEYRRRHPDRELTLLARGALADLWSLHPAPGRIIRYDGKPNFTHALFEELRQAGYGCAWVLPNSFRAAWIAFRAGIPRRAGMAGGYRQPLLTERRPRPADPNRRHQAWEYLALMVPGAKLAELPLPGLHLNPELHEAAGQKFGAWTDPVIGMIPGAARGPAKRWPVEHFIEAGRKFRRDGYAIALFGGREDGPVCAEIAAALDGGTWNLAGQTSIAEWAALMARCRLVIANDSGGMHLAAALGRPVIALYGMTDPSVTGPLGPACTVLQHSRLRSRDIARDSAEAQKSLASIRPEAVYEAAHVTLRSAAARPPDTQPHA